MQATSGDYDDPKNRGSDHESNDFIAFTAFVISVQFSCENF